MRAYAWLALLVVGASAWPLEEKIKDYKFLNLGALPAPHIPLTESALPSETAVAHLADGDKTLSGDETPILDAVIEDSIENLIPFGAIDADHTATVKKDSPPPTAAGDDTVAVPPLVDLLTLMVTEDLVNAIETTSNETDEPPAAAAPRRATSKLDWLAAALRGGGERHRLDEGVAVSPRSPLAADDARRRTTLTPPAVAADVNAANDALVRRALSPAFGATLLGEALASENAALVEKDDEARYEKTKFHWSKAFAEPIEGARPPVYAPTNSLELNGDIAPPKARDSAVALQPIDSEHFKADEHFMLDNFA